MGAGQFWGQQVVAAVKSFLLAVDSSQQGNSMKREFLQREGQWPPFDWQQQLLSPLTVEVIAKIMNQLESKAKITTVFCLSKDSFVLDSKFLLNSSKSASCPLITSFRLRFSD
ncbi:hypothetical protein WR25_14139 [Diploscapter pachys]|uniref:Uncharacterized protein n=1 Tax=Diploscapter pachys TaxID=2018661 RepID=A0A2A2KPD4_9BILA|nr:hypothetical protein WR25_14139 [Diploscapter pachys]